MTSSLVSQSIQIRSPVTLNTTALSTGDHRPSTVRCLIRRAADTTTTTTTTTTATHRTRPSTRTKRAAASVMAHSSGRTATLVALLLVLYAVARSPVTATSPASGDMSLLTMQRIKSYVDDTCTLDPHCQWTWDRFTNGLQNVSVEKAANLVPHDYMYPPGDDAEKSGQRGELEFYHFTLIIGTVGRRRRAQPNNMLLYDKIGIMLC